MLNQIPSSRRYQSCGSCGNHRPSRHRQFNEKALSFLIHCGEVEEQSVKCPMCEECYREIREVLIDRSDEFELALRHIPEHAISTAAEVARMRA